MRASIQIAWILLLALAAGVVEATTYNLPGNAVYDLGKLSKGRFDAKWGGGEIPDGFKPIRKGNYVSYSHGKLTYFFGPYKDAAALGKARAHLDGLRAQLIKQDSKFQSSSVETVKVGEPEGDPAGGPPGSPDKPEPAEPGATPGAGEQPEGEKKGVLSSESNTPEGKPGESPGGEKPGEPAPEDQPGTGKPGEGEPAETPPGGDPGEPVEGQPGEGKPGEKPPGAEDGKPEGEKPGSEGKPGDEPPGSETGKPGEGEPGAEEGEPEAEPKKGETGEAPAEAKPGEGEGTPPEGEPPEGEPGAEKAEPSEPGQEAGEKPPEGTPPEGTPPEPSEAEARPEGQPAEPVSANEPPPDWPAEPPGETSEFEEQASGAEMSGKQALERVPRAWPPFFGAALPAKVDLSGRMPAPGNQGKAPACTSWALAYALKSFQEQREESWALYQGGTLDTDRVYSPTYIHHQISDGTSKGAAFVDGLKLLREKGACTWSIMPYTPETAMRKASEGAHSNADKHRVDFYRLVKSYSVVDVKAQLHAGYPVLIGALLDPSFEHWRGDQVWKKEAEGAPAPHAMLCVGYDDGRSAFRIYNSWGTKWGDKGYGWIDYEAFTKIIAEAFVVKDGANARKRPLPNIEDFKVVVDAHALSGKELVFNGTVDTAPDYPGRMKLQIQFYLPDGSPVQASEQRYATIHGQAGNDAPPIELPVKAGHPWTIRIPRAALVTESTKLSAEVIQFVDAFGLTASERYEFELPAAELAQDPVAPPEEKAPPPEVAVAPEIAQTPPEEPAGPQEVEAENGEPPVAAVAGFVSMQLRVTVFLAVVAVVLIGLGFSIRAVKRMHA